VILLVSQPIVLCVLICGVVRSLLVQWFGVGMNVDLVRVSFGAAFFSPVEFVCDRVWLCCVVYILIEFWRILSASSGGSGSSDLFLLGLQEHERVLVLSVLLCGSVLRWWVRCHFLLFQKVMLVTSFNSQLVGFGRKFLVFFSERGDFGAAIPERDVISQCSSLTALGKSSQ
jgi:hypothetical protein